MIYLMLAALNVVSLLIAIRAYNDAVDIHAEHQDMLNAADELFTEHEERLEQIEQYLGLDTNGEDSDDDSN